MVTIIKIILQYKTQKQKRQ